MDGSSTVVLLSGDLENKNKNLKNRRLNICSVYGGYAGGL